VAAGRAGRAAIPFCSSPLGGRPIGRTPDSDSGYPGSSPGLPANYFQSLSLSLLRAWAHLRRNWGASRHHHFLQFGNRTPLRFFGRLYVECQRRLGRRGRNLGRERVQFGACKLAFCDELAILHADLRANANGKAVIVMRPKDDVIILVVLEPPFRPVNSVALAVLVRDRDDDLERTGCVSGFGL
jgi:hypothetical protein